MRGVDAAVDDGDGDAGAVDAELVTHGVGADQRDGLVQVQLERAVGLDERDVGIAADVGQRVIGKLGGEPVERAAVLALDPAAAAARSTAPTRSTARCRPRTATATARTSPARSVGAPTAWPRRSASWPSACSTATAAARTRA
jgi:hypothetical protein